MLLALMSEQVIRRHSIESLYLGSAAGGGGDASIAVIAGLRATTVGDDAIG